MHLVKPTAHRTEELFENRAYLLHIFAIRAATAGSNRITDDQENRPIASLLQEAFELLPLMPEGAPVAPPERLVGSRQHLAAPDASGALTDFVAVDGR